MSEMTVTLATPWIDATGADCTAAQIRERIRVYRSAPPAYAADIVEGYIRIGLTVAKHARGRASAGFAQSLHETAGLRFGGQVKPEQFNFGGLGATNDGSTGGSFGNIWDGWMAFWAHHMNYWWGAFDRWPSWAESFKEYAYRNAAVLSAGYGGVVTTIGDYTNGRWAWSPQYPKGTLQNGYAQAIVTGANAILALPRGEESPMLHVAIAAGHVNTAGGHPEEIVTVRPLVTELTRQLRSAGVKVSQITPDSGLFPGDHNAVARAVMDLDRRERVDLYWECHTEGTSNPANRGSFGVTPYWPRNNPTDRDTDAETISGDLAKRLQAATGLPVKGTNVIAPGVMAEYQTGVGNQGHRLGVFFNTAEAKAHMTRCIYEYGAHTSPADLAIQRQPWFSERAARATVETIAAFYGLEAEQPGGGGSGIQRPPEVSDPSARYFPQTGFWIQWGFKGYWEGNPNGLLDYGYPLTNEVTEDGRAVQYFERAVFEWHADIRLVLLRRLGAEALERRAA